MEEENRIMEQYKDLDVDAIVAEVDTAVAEGRTRRATKAEMRNHSLVALKSLKAYYMRPQSVYTISYVTSASTIY